MNHLIAIIIGAVFVNNFVLSQFLGICPFIGVSKSTRAAIGMGLAVTSVLVLVSAITWPVYHFILAPKGMEFLDLMVFILIIAALVQLLELLLKRYNQPLFQSLGIYLPLITTNCAILGVALLNVKEGLGFIESVVFGTSAGIGFLLALILMSAIRERLDLGDVPRPFQGVAIAFITAAMMSMAFLAFGSLPL